jgi:hypothetical protein
MDENQDQDHARNECQCNKQPPSTCYVQTPRYENNLVEAWNWFAQTPSYANAIAILRFFRSPIVSSSAEALIVIIENGRGGGPNNNMLIR